MTPHPQRRPHIEAANTKTENKVKKHTKVKSTKEAQASPPNNKPMGNKHTLSGENNLSLAIIQP